MNDLQQTLRELHRELADLPQLDPQQRALLEAALADIKRALAPQDQAESTPVHDVAPAAALESAAVRLETGHPGLASAIRAFVDALTKAGI
jgi:hypothetical protein